MPDHDFAGQERFDYTVSDGNGGSDTGTVKITVGPVNDAPVATGDAYGTSEDTPLTIAAAGVLANDSDVEGRPLTVALVACMIMTVVSSLFAIRRLWKVDPIMLFE